MYLCTGLFSLCPLGGANACVGWLMSCQRKHLKKKQQQQNDPDSLARICLQICEKCEVNQHFGIFSFSAATTCTSWGTITLRRTRTS